MSKSTISSIAAALVVGSASVALADVEVDANLQNRYPQATTQPDVTGRGVDGRRGCPVGGRHEQREVTGAKAGYRAALDGVAGCWSGCGWRRGRGLSEFTAPRK